jgi:hypothetical protein
MGTQRLAQIEYFKHQALTNTPVQVHTGPCRVLAYQVINQDTASPVYVKLFDTLASPLTTYNPVQLATGSTSIFFLGGGITNTTPKGLAPGMPVYGAQVPPGTVINTIGPSANEVRMNNTPTASGTTLTVQIQAEVPEWQLLAGAGGFVDQSAGNVPAFECQNGLWIAAFTSPLNNTATGPAIGTVVQLTIG